jgi:hypothetical protein
MNIYLLICRSRPSSRAGSEARRNDYESDQHDRTRTRSSRDKAYYDYRDRYRRDHRDPYSRGDYLLFRLCVMLGMHDFATACFVAIVAEKLLVCNFSTTLDN